MLIGIFLNSDTHIRAADDIRQIESPYEIKEEQPVADQVQQDASVTTETPTLGTKHDVIVNGDFREKIDILFVPARITDMNTMETFINQAMSYLFQYQPFAGRADMFNVAYLDVPIDEDFFGCTTVSIPFQSPRFSCNQAKIRQYYEDTFNVDFVTVLFDIPGFSSTGGQVMYLSYSGSGYIYVHEFGHQFGGLADEYTYNHEGYWCIDSQSETCYSDYIGKMPPIPNIDRLGCSKWCDGYNFQPLIIENQQCAQIGNKADCRNPCVWNDVPHPFFGVQCVLYSSDINIGQSCIEGAGCYMGADYGQMAFRSSSNSMMNLPSSDGSTPFNQVSQDHLVKTINCCYGANTGNQVCSVWLEELDQAVTDAGIGGRLKDIAQCQKQRYCQPINHQIIVGPEDDPFVCHDLQQAIDMTDNLSDYQIIIKPGRYAIDHFDLFYNKNITIQGDPSSTRNQTVLDLGIEGGGLWTHSSGLVKNLSIEGNALYNLLVISNSQVDFENVSIVNFRGSAVRLSSGAIVNMSDVLLSSRQYRGVQVDRQAVLNMDDSKIVNSAVGLSVYGTANIHDSLIANNASVGLDLDAAERVEVDKVTVVNNWRGIDISNIESPSPLVDISRTLIAFNSTGVQMDAVSIGSYTFTQNDLFGNETDVIGWDNPVGAVGNISVDPQFGEDDYCIVPQSPLVYGDANEGEYIGYRVCGTDPTPTPSPACRADVNGNGTVEIGDVSGILFYWGQSCAANMSACVADVNGNGNIEVGDIAGTLYYWNSTCTR